MTGQLTFLQPDPAAQSHSVTSRAAAEQIKPHVNEQHKRILAALRRAGPLTDEELVLAARLSPNSERPRRVELLKLGLISPAGKGVTSSGRKAQRWALS